MKQDRSGGKGDEERHEMRQDTRGKKKEEEEEDTAGAAGVRTGRRAIEELWMECMHERGGRKR